jgi:hypothetical protein
VVVVVLQMFCSSERNQPPSMGGLFVVHFLLLWCGRGAPRFYLLMSIIEQNEGNIVM